jgi:MYXO-CTERM domain-containing protein
MVRLDEACAVSIDPEAARALPIGMKSSARPPTSGAKRSGCCGAQTSPETPLAAALLTGALLLRPRRRRRGDERRR